MREVRERVDLLDDDVPVPAPCEHGREETGRQLGAAANDADAVDDFLGREAAGREVNHVTSCVRASRRATSCVKVSAPPARGLRVSRQFRIRIRKRDAALRRGWAAGSPG